MHHSGCSARQQIKRSLVQIPQGGLFLLPLFPPLLLFNIECPQKELVPLRRCISTNDTLFGKKQLSMCCKRKNKIIMLINFTSILLQSFTEMTFVAITSKHVNAPTSLSLCKKLQFFLLSPYLVQNQML